jgi:hypothetical protein
MDVSTYAANSYSGGGQISGPLFTFICPEVNDIPWYLPETPSGPAVSLLRHYRPKTRSVNVFVLSDGNVVQDTGTPENNDTNIPLPWITNDPSGPYAYTTNWDLTIETASLPIWIVYMYEGGHKHTINQTEANFLSTYTANGTGYSDRIVAI